MAEEQRCQSPKLCENNCGNPATQNLCSKCFRDSQLLTRHHHHHHGLLLLHRTPISSPSASDEAPVGSAAAAAPKNRCKACRRRVGLTGYECRCGSTFCGPHRHPESHACGFDYKAAGRCQIARDNPLVKAQKLLKI